MGNNPIQPGKKPRLANPHGTTRRLHSSENQSARPQSLAYTSVFESAAQAGPMLLHSA